MDFSNFFQKPLFNKATYAAAEKQANGQPKDIVYDDETDRIKRKRMIADMLLKQSQQSPQGQFIKNGDFMGYAGGSTLGSALLQGLNGLASNYAENEANTAQRELGEAIGEQNIRQARGPQGELVSKDEETFDALMDQLSKPDAPAQEVAANEPVQPTMAPAPAPVPSVSPTPNKQAAQAIVKNTGGATGSWTPNTGMSNTTGTSPSSAIAKGVQQTLNPPTTVAEPSLTQLTSSPAYIAARRSGIAPQLALEEARKSLAPVQPDPVAAVAKSRAGAGRGTVNPPMVDPSAPAPTAMPATTPAPAPTAAMPAMQPAASPIGQAVAGPAPMPREQIASAGYEDRTQEQARAGAGSRMMPTQAEEVGYWTNVARTGSPEMKAVAQVRLQQAMGPKREEFEYVKSDDGSIVAISKTNPNRNGVVYKGMSAKPTDTKEMADGTLMERGRDGMWRPAIDTSGSPVMTATGRESQNKLTEEKRMAQMGITDLKTRMADLTEGIELIKEVGTGRLQTPFNQIGAYFGDSTKLDKMNRLFNSQQLQGAIDFLKGQGSVTEGERALLSRATFDPKASTAANLDYANKVLGIIQRNLPLLESSYNQRFGAATSSAQPSAAKDTRSFSPYK